MVDREYDYLAPGRRYASRHSTPFAARTLPEMKAMVAYADPEQIRTTSHSWSAIHTDLVGGEDGGVLGVFDSIVTRLLQHWEGEAAEACSGKAEVLRKKVAGTAEYARYTSIALQGAANALQEYKTYIDAMSAESVPPDSRAQAKGVNAEDLLNSSRGELSSAQERQLEAAVVMEQLGAAYNSQVDAMASWSRESIVGADYPGAPGGTVPLADIRPVAYSVSLPGSPGLPRLPGPAGLSEFPGDRPPAPRDERPVAPRKPQIRTVIDGVSAVFAGSGVSGGLRSDVGIVAAGRRAGTFEAAPGVAGGIPKQRPPRGSGRTVRQWGVIGANDNSVPPTSFVG